MVALPEIADDVGNWTEPLGLLSITSEFAAAALGLVVLQSTRRTRD